MVFTIAVQIFFCIFAIKDGENTPLNLIDK